MLKYNNLLRSPDATDGGEVDPMSQAAASTDTSFPVLAGDRIYRMEIKSASVEVGKADAENKMLVLKLVTTKDATFSDGKKAKAGWPVFKRIGVVPLAANDKRQEYSPKDVAKNLALLNKAVGRGEKSALDTINDPKYLEGMQVDCRIGVAPAKGAYGESNTIAFVLPA